MGRRPGFDTAEVIATARDLYWANGFDGVSVADVERATGLSRSSVYHAFGSMRGLFDAAVTDYLDTIVRPRLRGLTADDVAPSALDRYLRGLATAISMMGVDDVPAGCLLVGATATSLGADATVRQVIADYRDELFTAIRAGLLAAHPGTDDAVIDRRADIVVGVVIGAMALARTGPEQASSMLTAAADEFATVNSRR